MQLFVQRLQCFWKKKYFFAHENIEKLPSNVAYNRPQNHPKYHILFHKNGSLRDFYILTLYATVLVFVFTCNYLAVVQGLWSKVNKNFKA